MKQTVINNWAIVTASLDPYLAPELHKQYLYGDVEGYSGPVTTSSIQGKRGENIITRHTEYVLGVVDPKYELQFPNAKQRLLNSTSEI